ncbi:MAG: hypothetical protein MJZ66_00600 [Bacteroidales bacterium]|nr:hypothetical protein [Bacteroidales bacterium]
MRRLLIIAAALMLGTQLASAQEIVKQKKVPQAVQVQYINDVSKTACKKAVWYQTGDFYTAEYEGIMKRYTQAGTPLWTSQKIAKDDVDTEILEAFSKKYGVEYPYQWAEKVTMASGEKFTYIVGKKKKYNYYFKYNEKKVMVEKVATNK